MEKPVKSQEMELSIDTLAFGGRGVARRDGFVIFVEGAVPGDRVRAEVTRAKRSYAEARTLELLAPSDERVEPACFHFGACGGCSWQSLAYEAQMKYKQQQVSECLKHIGRLSEFQSDEPLAAGNLWRYRNKVEFSFAAGEGGEIDLGFHLPGDWRRVVSIDNCLLHSQITNRIRNRVRDFARASGLGAYDQRSGGAGFYRHLVLKEGINTGEVLVNLVTAPGKFPQKKEFVQLIASEFPEVTSLVWSINDTKASVAAGFPFQVLAGRGYIREKIRGLELKVSPSSFLQTNTSMAERLYGKVLEYAALGGGESVIDLYSGTGSIALLMAKQAREVWGVEIAEEAVALAWENARANRAGNARFRAGRVRSVLKYEAPQSRPDLVVLDPPRAGAGSKEIQRLAELGAPRIVYVSCNVSTLAGNAAQLTQSGYRLVRTGAVDMFPHTPHIEVVARFEKEVA